MLRTNGNNERSPKVIWVPLLTGWYISVIACEHKLFSNHLELTALIFSKVLCLYVYISYDYVPWSCWSTCATEVIKTFWGASLHVKQHQAGRFKTTPKTKDADVNEACCYGWRQSELLSGPTFREEAAPLMAQFIPSQEQLIWFQC